MVQADPVCVTWFRLTLSGCQEILLTIVTEKLSFNRNSYRYKYIIIITFLLLTFLIILFLFYFLHLFYHFFLILHILFLRFFSLLSVLFLSDFIFYFSSSSFLPSSSCYFTFFLFSFCIDFFFFFSISSWFLPFPNCPFTPPSLFPTSLCLLPPFPRPTSTLPIPLNAVLLLQYNEIISNHSYIESTFQVHSQTGRLATPATPPSPLQTFAPRRHVCERARAGGRHRGHPLQGGPQSSRCKLRTTVDRARTFLPILQYTARVLGTITWHISICPD